MQQFINNAHCVDHMMNMHDLKCVLGTFYNHMTLLVTKWLMSKEGHKELFKKFSQKYVEGSEAKQSSARQQQPIKHRRSQMFWKVLNWLKF